MSKIIKLSRQEGKNSILVTRRSGMPSGSEGGFQALSSLWQSDDTELAAALSQLEIERERLLQEKESARAEGEAIVSEAKEQAAQIEKEAYAAGFAAGKEEALSQEKEKLDCFMADLDALLKGIETDRQRFFAQYEKEIVTLVKAMVDRVLLQEVSINPQVIEVCLRTALSYVVENSAVTVRMHGDDLERIKRAAMERPDILSGYKRIDLHEDPTISPGGCLLETSFGEIDATLDSRRDKVCAAIDAILKRAATQTQ